MNIRSAASWLSVGCVSVSLAIIVVVGSVSAGELSVDGYLKSYASAYWFPDYSLIQEPIAAPPLGAVSNRLRLKARWGLSRRVTVNVAYDIESRTQDHLLFADDAIAGLVGKSYRIDDLDRRLYPGESDRVRSFGLFQNLDRAQVEIRVGRVDFYLGRQAIAWGVARVVNPTDILTAFSYSALDTEDRVGVDALRARVALGFMSELDVGVVAGKDFEAKNSMAYLRYKTHVEQADVTGIVAGFREHAMVGFDLTRAIGSAGSWVEAAYVWPKLLQPRSDLSPDGYWRASVGADYSPGANTYCFAEYHYNQPGSSDPATYGVLPSTPAYADGSVYLLGEHYLIPGITHQITPLVTGTMEILCNLSDGSAYVAPSVEYNLAENVYLSAGAFVGIGSGPSSSGQPESEFGAYPNTFYSSFRFYF